ncbi:hypothetical protein TNCV_2062371 [Trichonephila clavipes]|nr:hypothetical protein TNCV_2062371 [Trichonephila clavipes]
MCSKNLLSSSGTLLDLLVDCWFPVRRQYRSSVVGAEVNGTPGLFVGKGSNKEFVDGLLFPSVCRLLLRKYYPSCTDVFWPTKEIKMELFTRLLCWLKRVVSGTSVSPQ